MNKIKKSFFCQNCGAQHVKWQGQCNTCKEWNSLLEEIISNESSQNWTALNQRDHSSSSALQINQIRKSNETKNSRKRPLLNNINNTKDLKKFYEKRKKVYALSDFKINCDNKTEDAIIDEIIGIYENS